LNFPGVLNKSAKRLEDDLTKLFINKNTRMLWPGLLVSGENYGVSWRSCGHSYIMAGLAGEEK
jgi:hypothetical protein